MKETGLVGTQYSWLNSIVYVAELIWQPVSSYLLVKLPLSKYCQFYFHTWVVYGLTRLPKCSFMFSCGAYASLRWPARRISMD